MTTKRITAAEVVEAYETTGMRPLASDWWSDDGTRGCGLFVLGVARGLTPRSGVPDFPEFRERMEMSQVYERRFAEGWDDRMSTRAGLLYRQQYAGYQD